MLDSRLSEMNMDIQKAEGYDQSLGVENLGICSINLRFDCRYPVSLD